MSRFPIVDLHAMAAEAGVDLPEAFGRLREIYDDVEARNAENTKDLDLPCHRGCDMCCHESVFLTPLEFFLVWDYIQQNYDEATRQEIAAKGLALYDENRALIEALEEPPPDGEADHLSIAQKIKFTCPILGPEGECRVYPVRELYARMFGCSFNDAGGVYGCHLVGEHLAGKTITLLKVRPQARRLDDLPLTGKRQVYPYYIHLLYG